MDSQRNKAPGMNDAPSENASPREVEGEGTAGRRRILMQALAGAPVILTISAGPAHASHDGATNHETCEPPAPPSKKCGMGSN